MSTEKNFQAPDCVDEVGISRLRLLKGFPAHVRVNSKATDYIPMWRLC